MGILHKCDHILAVEKNTWYFQQNTAMEQMLYSLKRFGEPCRDHIGNNFVPVSEEYASAFIVYRDKIVDLYERAKNLLTADADEKLGDCLRAEADALQKELSAYSKTVLDVIHNKPVNISAMTVYLSIIQESQTLLSSLRHYIRCKEKFLA